MSSTPTLGMPPKAPAGPQLAAFARTHLDGVLQLFEAEGWQTYTADRERTFRALAAAGCTTLVAVDHATVVALVQLQSDGEIQAHLSALVVAAGWRRRGLARLLLAEALRRAGGERLDVLSRAEAFYAGLGARPRPGFRVLPEDLGNRNPQ